MKAFVDGDNLCVTDDDFVNLQESPAQFVPLKDVGGLTEAIRAERENAFRMIYSAFDTMRGQIATREGVLHTLDTIKPYVLGEKTDAGH